MKLKSGFVLREVSGSAMVIATGEAAKTYRGMIKLNETARVIWQSVSEGKQEEEIVQEFVTKYGISVEEAKVDVAKMLAQMKDAGFLCE